MVDPVIEEAWGAYKEAEFQARLRNLEALQEARESYQRTLEGALDVYQEARRQAEEAYRQALKRADEVYEETRRWAREAYERIKSSKAGQAR